MPRRSKSTFPHQNPHFSVRIFVFPELFGEISRQPTRRFSVQAALDFLCFFLLESTRQGRGCPACCPPHSDIDANPDANGDGTKRAWLDKMR